MPAIRPSRAKRNPIRRCRMCYRANVKHRNKQGDGYIEVMVVPGRGGKRELEHRVVMEKIIGRSLRPEEVVHHINGDKENNSPENLRLFPNRSIHQAIEHGKRR